MKYIIKNCDCLNLGACCAPNADKLYCKDITDCVIKQIVNKCQETKCDCLIDKNKCGRDDFMASCCDVFFKKEILELLEIEEVDD